MEERLRMMQEATDRFEAIYAAKKAEYDQRVASGEIIERTYTNNVPADAWKDESELSSSEELGYPPSITSSDEARFETALAPIMEEDRESEPSSEDEASSMPELISMEEGPTSYRECTAWRAPSMAPTETSSQAAYGSGRISPVQNELEALQQLAEYASKKTPLAVPTALHALSVPVAPHSTPAEGVFFRPGTPKPPRILLDSGAETTIYALAEEGHRQQLKQGDNQLTQNAVLTGHWHDAYTFNMELSRRLHSATPTSYNPAVSHDNIEDESASMSRTATPIPGMNPDSSVVNTPESNSDKENQEMEKGKGRLVVAEYSKADQLITPILGEGNKHKLVHRDHWSSSNDEACSDESSSSGLDLYSTIDLSDVINFGSPQPVTSPLERDKSDTESIDAAEFMRLIEQITGRASRGPLPIHTPVNDNPSGIYPWKAYLEEEHLRARAWEDDWALQPFQQAQEILEERLSSYIDYPATITRPLFTYQPLARKVMTPPLLYQQPTSLDFSLPTRDSQVPPIACVRANETVDPRCIEGRCSHEPATHNNKTIDEKRSPSAVPRRTKRYRESDALRRSVLRSEALKAAYLASAEIIDDLISARAALKDGFSRVEDIIIRHRFDLDAAVPSEQKREHHPLLYNDEAQNLRFAQRVLNQAGRHTLARCIGELLRVCFRDEFAISQLLKAGFLDQSYVPSDDEWDEEMWEVEHDDEDADEGMAVDEFDIRNHQESASKTKYRSPTTPSTVTTTALSLTASYTAPRLWFPLSIKFTHSYQISNRLAGELTLQSGRIQIEFCYAKQLPVPPN
ncbi:hypothetical protein C8J57DRAFT_1217960 [Mycena rebaudengoi]|nr:hypothetical protein C8J57DRAFT_1217960 [Mycena rebaudengoi]